MSSSEALYCAKPVTYFGHPRTDIKALLPDNVSSILEIGCAEGATMRWLRTIRNIDYAIGIELVPNAAQRAELAFDKLLVGNIESMVDELSPKSFDLIIALDVLEHLVDPWKIVSLCKDLLKPDGLMIISLPNIAHFSVVMPLLIRGRWNYQSEGLLDITHLRFFTLDTAIKLVTAAGFAVERVQNVRIPPKFLSLVPDKLGGRRLRWYALKLLNRIPSSHLLDFKYLIRARIPS